jgi:murein L,D-transpeptidase YafK
MRFVKYIVLVFLFLSLRISFSQVDSNKELWPISNYSQPKILERKPSPVLALNKLMVGRDEKGKMWIKIEKSKMKLIFMYDSNVVKEYPVVFGPNYLKDKLKKGDKATPEGTFKVIASFQHEFWSRFITLSYPNKESIEKFNDAKKAGKIPSNSKMGGSIGIHGVVEGSDYLIDDYNHWTYGCISMKRAHIEELSKYVTEKMKVEIVL